MPSKLWLSCAGSIGDRPMRLPGGVVIGVRSEQRRQVPPPDFVQISAVNFLQAKRRA